MTTILITGAARGIGHELTERALARGDTVFAVVRKAADAARFSASPALHVLVMDVADTESVQQGFKQMDGRLAGSTLDAVINCAAIAPCGAVELTPVAEFERVLNTNTLGSLRILKEAIPRLRGHGGRLILLTSLWGRTSGALLGAYCASKHAIESLADTARRETGGMNLHIIVVEPGVVKTEMYTNQAPAVQTLVEQMSTPQRAHYGALYARYLALVGSTSGSAVTVSQAAAGIERALFARRPRLRYRVGIDSKIVCALAWLVPDRCMDWMMGLRLNNKPLPASSTDRASDMIT